MTLSKFSKIYVRTIVNATALMSEVISIHHMLVVFENIETVKAVTGSPVVTLNNVSPLM